LISINEHYRKTAEIQLKDEGPIGLHVVNLESEDISDPTCEEAKR